MTSNAKLVDFWTPYLHGSTLGYRAQDSWTVMVAFVVQNSHPSKFSSAQLAMETCNTFLKVTPANVIDMPHPYP